MKKSILFPLLMVLFIIFFSCGEEENPLPVLTSISPLSKVVHMPSFTLTLDGQKFVQGATVVFNGNEKSTNFISANQLTCQINTSDIVEATAIMGNGNLYPESLKDANVQVLVKNPAPGGGSSAAQNFLIKSSHSFAAPAAIADPSLDTGEADIMVDNQGNIHVIYYYYTDDNCDLMYTESSDGGVTWSVPVTLASGCGGWSDSAKMEIDNGNVYIAWIGYEGDTVYVSYRYLNSATNTWSQPYKVCELVSTNVIYYDIWDVDMVVNNQEVFIAVATYYQDYSSYRDFSYFYYSNDLGMSFNETPLTFMGEFAYVNDIVLLNNEVIGLVYYDWLLITDEQEIFFTRSSDKGANWSTPVRIIPTTDTGVPSSPRIVADSTGQNIYAIWESYFAQSPGVSSIESSIPRNKHDLIVLKRKSSRAILANTCNPQAGETKIIHFSHSADGGNTWSTPSIVYNYIFTHPSYFLGYEPVLDSAGNINVIFNDMDSPSIQGIAHGFFMRSIDNGATWSTPQDVGMNTLSVWADHIAINTAGDIFILLDYFTSLSPFRAAVYFCKSTQ